MTTIIRAAHAAHFLSLLPPMLGYTPAHSLVLVPFANSRSIGAMRFDLPDDEDCEQVASTCIGMVCRLADADELAAVVYTDDALADAGAMPSDGLVHALAQRADACGLHLRDALCVASDAWGSYLDPECPPAGRDLADLASDPRAQAPDEADQLSGARLPALAEQEEQRVAQALDGLEEAVRTLCGTGDDVDAAPAARTSPAAWAEGRIDPRALAAACRLDDLPALFEEVLGRDPQSLDPFTAALMVWALSRPAFRDIALMQWCGDEASGDQALQAQLRWEAGEEYPAELGERMWGEGPRPDTQRIRAALELARCIAASAPSERQAGPLAACAWLSWAQGRSTHAAVYAQQACDREPEHGLGEIVLSFTAMGHLPAWAFTPAERSRVHATAQG